jgi:CRP-like cAMP-binding protein
VVSGSYLVAEHGVSIHAGEVVGELGFIARDNRRTQTVECTCGGKILVIRYDKLRELCFQNPTSGFYLMHLSSERLLQNIARLESLADRYRSTAPTQSRGRPLKS